MASQGSKGYRPWSATRKASQAARRLAVLPKKKIREMAQEEVHKANLDTIRLGGHTPWQKAKAKRLKERH